MDIKIRNVDVLTVKKLDALAKKKDMSRESFLREQLHLLANEDIQRRFEEVLKKNHDMLQAAIVAQRELFEKLSLVESILLIALDIDESELNETLNLWKGVNENE